MRWLLLVKSTGSCSTLEYFNEQEAKCEAAKLMSFGYEVTLVDTYDGESVDLTLGNDIRGNA